MTPLERIIRKEAEATGGVPVARYMELCLTHPEHGYYMTRQPFGREGDFITAPEASQIFGELLGVWAAAGWRAMGAPEAFSLVELGPGRGTLMADALRAAKVMPGFLRAARVRLVEISPRLRKAQEEALSGVEASWHETFGDIPEGPLIVLANEFFDALPAHQFRRTPEGWRERLVRVGPGGGLEFADAGAPLEEPPEWARDLPVGALIELSPEREEYAAGIAARIAAHGGAMLALDYGHVRPGPGETLQALAGHRRVSVFHEPGRSDLTAHVDFHALAVAMERGGAVCWGPVEQGAFLRAMGLAARYEMLRRRATARQRIVLKRGVERIAGEAHMGRLFKVLAAVAPGMPPPAPFEGEQT